MCRKIWVVCVVMMGLSTVQFSGLGGASQIGEEELFKVLKTETIWEKEFDEQQIKFVERVPYSTEKEKYVSKVLIKFNAKCSILRGPYKKEAGPYELGIYEWGETGGMVAGPRSIAVDDCSNIYILDVINKRIQKYDRDGNFLLTINMREGGGNDLCVDKNSSVYVLDRHPIYDSEEEFKEVWETLGINKQNPQPFQIRKYDSQGLLLWKKFFPFPKSLHRKYRVYPARLYVGNDGTLYVGSYQRVFMLASDGTRFLKLKKVIDGVPISKNRFFDYNKSSDGRKVYIHTRSLKQKKSKTMEIVLADELIGMEYLGEDNKDNTYLLLTKVDKSDNVWREIKKIDPFGETLASIENIPRFLDNPSLERDIAVSNDGEIYWLKYWARRGNKGAELIKWYKEEGQ